MKYTKLNEEKRKARVVGRLIRELAVLTPEELRRLQQKIQQAIRAKKRKGPSTVPVEVFATKLSPAEAVVKYLKEEYGLTFSEIAQLINRDQRGIWNSYSRAQSKLLEPFVIKESACEIPISVLRDRSRSILEHVVAYLKDERKFTPSHICTLLKKQTSTVWTVYNRSKKKSNE